MNNRKEANLERINRLWRLHEPVDAASGAEGQCLAFAIDKRYLERDGLEWRFGVSFGHNVVTPETKQGFVQIPVHPGEFVFGVHVIANKGDKVSLYDRWVDARPAGSCTDAADGEKLAREILQSLSDDEYLASVRDSPNEKGPLKTSASTGLEDFEVVEGEAW